MRVLQLVHALPVGGTEVMVSELTRRLTAAGIDTSVVCLDFVGELGERLRSDGIEVHELGRRPGLDRGLPGRIAEVVRSGPFDVVHAHQYTCFFYGALARRKAGAPLVFTEHGRFYPDVPKLKRRLFNRVFRSRADRTTAVSRGVWRSLVEIEAFRPEGVEVIYNGVDVERFGRLAHRASARRALGVPDDVPLIGTIGRLDSIKNQAVLVRVLARLRSSDHASTGASERPRLAIVGEGPEHDSLVALVSELGLRDSVVLPGRIDDVTRVLGAFDVFVLPSRSEGTPVTLLEAMAARVPIVATDVGGIPEILEDGTEALLVDGSRTDAEVCDSLSQAIDRCLSDASTGRALVESAHARVRREFSLEAMCDRYREIYEQVAAARPVRA